MFEGRVKVLLGLIGVLGMVLVARLAELQIARGSDYRAFALRMLSKPLESIPSVRGRILDRNGQVLAREIPSWSICVHYGLIADDPEHVRQLARLLKTDAPQIRERIDRMWRQLSRLSGLSRREIDDRRRSIVRRVDLIREDFERRHGYETTMREELMLHPMVRDLDDQEQVRVRLALESLLGVEVRSATSRWYRELPTLGHLLGRLGEVDQGDLDKDPQSDDPLRNYQPGDMHGTAGLEYACETTLRGSRGLIVENRDGQISKRIEPSRGGDVTLSMDLDLQTRLYDVLGAAVADLPEASGAAAVVLDVDSRECLALVSYPGFNPSDYRLKFDELAADAKSSPLIWRAVSGRYAPGSIVKPLVLSAARSAGIISDEFGVDCRGSLFPEHPDVWREWRSYVTRRPMQHGFMTGVDALKNSCQVFFYTVGEAMGGRRLCDWFQMAGFGRSVGLGLLEEASGVVPTPQWLATHAGRHNYLKADGRNYAVGQGELLITPVHAANLAALYATGAYMPVNMILNDGRERAVWQLPVSPEVWSTARRGMWKVINEPGGTAFNSVKLRSDRYEMCGKSGSAEASCRVIAYEAAWRNSRGEFLQETVPVHSKRQARERILNRYERDGEEVNELSLRPAQWWPHEPDPSKPRPSHAWFIGFVQPKSDGSFLSGGRASISFAVMIEYGGSGGRATGPVAARIVRIVIDEFPQYVSER